MRRPIAIGLSPNTFLNDVVLAVKMLLSPFSYKNGSGIEKIETWFKNYFKTRYAFSFNSGRGALYFILKSLDIKDGDEVIIQSFTCVAVPNAIIAAGAKPIYTDVTKELTIDPIDMEKKITKKTKALIIQHNFNIPTDLKKIIPIIKKYNITLIEDAAHGIGGEYKNKKLGSFGKVSFFSFGRDKAFSSVFGGMAVTSNDALGQKLNVYYKKLPMPSAFWIFQQLMHPVSFFFILPVYNFLSFGKLLIVILQTFRIISFPVSSVEKKGIYDKGTLSKLPNALAVLALNQLKKIDIFNRKREEIVMFYLKELKGLPIEILYNHKFPLLRFPILVKDQDLVLKHFRKKGIYLGNWYSNLIDPKGVDFEKVYYKHGMCPQAEKYAREVVNLPTYPAMSLKDAQKIVEVLKECLQ